MSMFVILRCFHLGILFRFNYLMNASIDSTMITSLPQKWIENALMLLKTNLKQNRTDVIQQLVSVNTDM